MGFSIDHLVGVYKDFARGYLFYAEVVWPVGLAVGGIPTHQFLVSSTQLPPNTIDTTEVNWQGMKYNVPTTQTFENHTITFKSDHGQELRKSFLRWMKGMHDPVTNTQVLSTGGQTLGYAGVVKLTQLDGNQQPVMTYNLINAFPVSVGEIALDYGTKEISTFNVDFSYQYHVASDVDVGSITDAIAGAGI